MFLEVVFWGCHVFVHLYLKLLKTKRHVAFVWLLYRSTCYVSNSVLQYDCDTYYKRGISFIYLGVFNMIRSLITDQIDLLSNYSTLFCIICQCITGYTFWPITCRLAQRRPIGCELVRLRQRATRSFQNGSWEYHGLVRTLQNAFFTAVIDQLAVHMKT